MRIIPAHRKYRHKRPVPVHGSAIDAAERTFSAARLSDILRGSYRLTPQSPASSQFPAGVPPDGSPCASSLSIPYMVLIVKQKFSFFHKFFSYFLCLLPFLPPDRPAGMEHTPLSGPGLKKAAELPKNQLLYASCSGKIKQERMWEGCQWRIKAATGRGSNESRDMGDL